MTQIRSVQIIPSTVDSNQSVALPRDLEQNLISTATTVVAPTDATGGSSVGMESNSFGDFGGFNPATPAIISVKSQTVNILDDGSATIDVVLVLEDIVGVSEYDIRVAKNAGSL